jgi:hypothetical protein
LRAGSPTHAATAPHLVVRLRAADRKALAQHPALGWHFQLIAGPDGPLALAPNVTIAVQLGDTEITARETVPDGRLQVLASEFEHVRPIGDQPTGVGASEQLSLSHSTQLANHVLQNLR